MQIFAKSLLQVTYWVKLKDEDLNKIIVEGITLEIRDLSQV